MGIKKKKGKTEMEEKAKNTKTKKETTEETAKRLSLYEKRIRELKEGKKEEK